MYVCIGTTKDKNNNTRCKPKTIQTIRHAPRDCLKYVQVWFRSHTDINIGNILVKMGWLYTSTGALIYNVKALISKIFHYD